MAERRVDWRREARQLGTMPDAELARRLGVSTPCVRGQRHRRGIPPFAPRPPLLVWTRERVALLGRLPDEVLARRWRISKSSVICARIANGVPAPGGFRPQRRAVRWTRDMLRDLATRSCLLVSRTYAIPLYLVRAKRTELGISPLQAPRIIRWTRALLSDLRRLSVRDFIRRHRLAQTAVRDKRAQLGIRHRNQPLTLTAAQRRQLGVFFDKELAARWRVGIGAVRRARVRMGIAVCSRRMIHKRRRR